MNTKARLLFFATAVMLMMGAAALAGAADLESLNRLNQDILVELQESGVAAPSYTTLQGAYCLRVAISNHRSRFEDFDLLVSEVLRIGQALNPKTAT